MTTETIEFATANGDTTAYVATPESGNGKAVMLIHEWWGLNDHIKDIAGRYAAEGFIAIAPDLYRGKIATDPENASKMMHALAIEDGLDTIGRAVSEATARYGVSHLGITGYCMGGTFALRARARLKALPRAVPFYGDIRRNRFLQNFAFRRYSFRERDGWITPARSRNLRRRKTQTAGRIAKVRCRHAFFNNTRPEVFDEDAASDAWSRAVTFFNSNL